MQHLFSCLNVIERLEILPCPGYQICLACMFFCKARVLFLIGHYGRIGELALEFLVSGDELLELVPHGCLLSCGAPTARESVVNIQSGMCKHKPPQILTLAHLTHFSYTRTYIHVRTSRTDSKYHHSTRLTSIKHHWLLH